MITYINLIYKYSVYGQLFNMEINLKSTWNQVDIIQALYLGQLL